MNVVYVLSVVKCGSCLSVVMCGSCSECGKVWFMSDCGKVRRALFFMIQILALKGLLHY